MQRIKAPFFHIIFVIIGTFVLFSCASNPNVAGKWINVENNESIEFSEDGSFSGVDNMGALFNGNYVINDGNIMLKVTHTDIMRETMQPEIYTEIVNAKFSISKNELLLFLTVQEGKLETQRYQRDN